MTLVALPTRVSTTAQGTIQNQRRQLAGLAADYDRLRASLVVEERDTHDVSSPLALLLNRIRERAHRLLGVAPDNFLDWLERTAPTTVSQDAGTGAGDGAARLADAIDELDSILLTSLEEVARIDGAGVTRARVEAQLATLWQKTFTAVATEQEDWLETAFVRRGIGVIEHIYPDQDERRKLYQYGLPPTVGRRFTAVARQIHDLLVAADGYGSMDPTSRIGLFESLGDLVSGDRGFGFRVRRTNTDEAILAHWSDVLEWWLNKPGAAGPAAEILRSWQRFVAENLEFRLGVAIGAVLAEAWAKGTDDAFETPSLAGWKDTTGLPWVGFWARELLRWGTHDPFVAFCLAQGLAPTRDAATVRRRDFDSWLEVEVDAPSSEDRIDPQLFLRWQGSLARPNADVPTPLQIRTTLTGTAGARGSYAVIPVTYGERISWIDPAGFELASTTEPVQLGGQLWRSDFELVTAGSEPAVKRTFLPS